MATDYSLGFSLGERAGCKRLGGWFVAPCVAAERSKKAEQEQ